MKPKKFRGQTLAGADLVFSVQCIYQEPNLPGEIVVESKEQLMANDKDPNRKRPGEKPEGKYHYNPGNQSGKTAEIIKPESERENNVDRIKNRHEAPNRKG